MANLGGFLSLSVSGQHYVVRGIGFGLGGVRILTGFCGGPVLITLGIRWQA